MVGGSVQYVNKTSKVTCGFHLFVFRAFGRRQVLPGLFQKFSPPPPPRFLEYSQLLNQFPPDVGATSSSTKGALPKRQIVSTEIQAFQFSNWHFSSLVFFHLPLSHFQRRRIGLSNLAQFCYLIFVSPDTFNICLIKSFSTCQHPRLLKVTVKTDSREHT